MPCPAEQYAYYSTGRPIGVCKTYIRVTSRQEPDAFARTNQVNPDSQSGIDPWLINLDMPC
jgi:hypothetical protein